MFTVDKKKFGSFVAELRREKGYTQKELAIHLHLSDKAVSKWETGVSIPDTALLIPLADLLGVSVTELLVCEKMKSSAPLGTDRVESIVKTAVAYTDGKSGKPYEVNGRWIVLYVIALLMGCMGVFLNYKADQPCLETLTTFILLSAIFGGYFCCFVKIKLPAFYDENSVHFFCDGVFRMNMPGMSFNNCNWPYIVKTFRICVCADMAMFPAINYFMGSVAGRGWTDAGKFVLLAAFLCSFFVPVYIVGKKYE